MIFRKLRFLRNFLKKFIFWIFLKIIIFLILLNFLKKSIFILEHGNLLRSSSSHKQKLPNLLDPPNRPLPTLLPKIKLIQKLVQISKIKFSNFSIKTSDKNFFLILTIFKNISHPNKLTFSKGIKFMHWTVRGKIIGHHRPIVWAGEKNIFIFFWVRT